MVSAIPQRFSNARLTLRRLCKNLPEPDYGCSIGDYQAGSADSEPQSRQQSQAKQCRPAEGLKGAGDHKPGEARQGHHDGGEALGFAPQLVKSSRKASNGNTGAATEL